MRRNKQWITDSVRPTPSSQYEPVVLTSAPPACWTGVRARMLAGQVVDDWGKVANRLCKTFGAADCRVQSVPGRPHELECWFLISDPLEDVIRPT